jgi:hypothetical protein
MDIHKEHVRKCLESNGFKVQEIAESPEERADLLASYYAENYLVEVKGKELSEEAQQLVNDADRDGIASIDRAPCYRNRLDGIVRKAHAQLLATPGPPGAFRLLCVSCLSGDDDFIHHEFHKTLYGLNELMVLERIGEAPRSMLCFYYHHNSFYRCREIDAAILSGRDGAHLCVNEFGLNVAALRCSHLYTVFPRQSIFDPGALVESGQALAIRANIDRQDAKALWQYLFDTYQVMTQPGREVHFTGMLSMPVPEQRDDGKGCPA